MKTYKHGSAYRQACLRAGHAGINALAPVGKGESNDVWTKVVYPLLRLVAWGGGDVLGAARSAGAVLGRKGDAAGSARAARKETGAPSLVGDAWEAWLQGDGRDDRAPALVRHAPASPRDNGKPLLPYGALHAFLESCVPVTADPLVSAWLTGRALDPVEVTCHGLALALPVDAVCPPWAGWSKGGSWASTGYRLICPTFDCDGWLAGVRARRVIDVPVGAWNEKIKVVPARGHRCKGLVLACLRGRALLAGDAGADGVLLVEGEPDFLTMATALDGAGPVVIGTCGNAPEWFGAVDARRGVAGPWLLGFDTDGPGQNYADKAGAQLEAGRVERVAPGNGRDGNRRDWNDCAQRGVLPSRDALVGCFAPERTTP